MAVNKHKLTERETLIVNSEALSGILSSLARTKPNKEFSEAQQIAMTKVLQEGMNATSEALRKLSLL